MKIRGGTLDFIDGVGVKYQGAPELNPARSARYLIVSHTQNELALYKIWHEAPGGFAGLDVKHTKTISRVWRQIVILKRKYQGDTDGLTKRAAPKGNQAI